MQDTKRKGIYQDVSGYQWEYYGDDSDRNCFYIVPRPQLALNSNGRLSFEIVRYSNNHSAPDRTGHCCFTLALSVPMDIQHEIAALIPAQFADATAPFFKPLPFVRGSKAFFHFAHDGRNLTVSAPVSHFGRRLAAFFLALNESQLNAISAASQVHAGFGRVEYQLLVPARLPDVKILLTFNSGVAYLYQLNQPATQLVDLTNARENLKFLQNSGSIKTHIAWTDGPPSSDLAAAIEKWTLETISNEVAKAARARGLRSGEPKDISEVGCFTQTFDKYSVINWIANPSAEVHVPSSPMPRAAGMPNGLPPADIPTAEASQVMTVVVDLPFTTDPDASTLAPAVNGEPMLVDHVNVTVEYPTLDQNAATHTFTADGSQIFTAPFNDIVGSKWNAHYEVVYSGSGLTVKGTAVAITDDTWTLEIENAGILSVVFDASEAFATETAKPLAVQIALSYMDSSSASQLIRQTVTINQTDNPQRATINGFQPTPIIGSYNYQVTYIYGNQTTYRAPLMQMHTAAQQIIPAAAAAHATNILAAFPSASPWGAITQVIARFWYAQPPTLPAGVSTVALSPDEPSAPLVSAPAIFWITPDQGSGTVMKTFYGFLNGDQPLVYSALISTTAGPIAINAQMIENDQPSVTISPDQRYFTLEIDPSLLDWSQNYQSVEVLITAAISRGDSAHVPRQPGQRLFIWNQNETGKKYITYPIFEGNLVTYDWEVNYLTPGQAVRTLTRQSRADNAFSIPAPPEDS